MKRTEKRWNDKLSVWVGAILTAVAFLAVIIGIVALLISRPKDYVDTTRFYGQRKIGIETVGYIEVPTNWRMSGSNKTSFQAKDDTASYAVAVTAFRKGTEGTDGKKVNSAKELMEATEKTFEEGGATRMERRESEILEQKAYVLEGYLEETKVWFAVWAAEVQGKIYYFVVQGVEKDPDVFRTPGTFSLEDSF